MDYGSLSSPSFRYVFGYISRSMKYKGEEAFQ